MLITTHSNRVPHIIAAATSPVSISSLFPSDSLAHYTYHHYFPSTLPFSFPYVHSLARRKCAHTYVLHGGLDFSGVLPRIFPGGPQEESRIEIGFSSLVPSNYHLVGAARSVIELLGERMRIGRWMGDRRDGWTDRWL